MGTSELGSRCRSVDALDFPIVAFLLEKQVLSSRDVSDDVPRHIWEGASHYVPGSPATCAPRAWRCRLRRCPQNPSAVLSLRGSGNVSRLFL